MGSSSIYDGIAYRNMEDVEGIADFGNKVVDAYMSVPKEKGKGT